jgi:hypothetical protein
MYGRADVPAYLTASEYPAVRAAIDVSLDASNLPDAVISLPMYAQEAERWVLAQNPLAATYAPNTDAFKRMQVAAIYACAALILPALPQLTAEVYGQAYRYTRQEVDATAQQNALWARARASIQAELGDDETVVSGPPLRFIFARAEGRRGA